MIFIRKETISIPIKVYNGRVKIAFNVTRLRFPSFYAPRSSYFSPTPRFLLLLVLYPFLLFFSTALLSPSLSSKHLSLHLPFTLLYNAFKMATFSSTNSLMTSLFLYSSTTCTIRIRWHFDHRK